MTEHVCPVCRWPHLTEPPRSEDGGGSYEICWSCGFEFGVTDDDLGYSFDAWRRLWLSKGAPWASQTLCPPPDGWDPTAQLRGIGVSE